MDWDKIVEQQVIRHEKLIKEGFFTKEKDKPTEIVIKPEALDTSALQGSDKKESLWRPAEFKQYIGQENLKKLLKGYINGTKKLNKTFPHMLIDGKAGTGKTTIAYLLAKKLGLPFVECVTNTVASPQQFVDKLAKCQGGILFLDEIHDINKKVGNFILPLLEDFSINGQKIRPFTLFGATTEKGKLIKNFKPLVDRMKIQKTLDDYTIEELKILAKQYKEKSFGNISIDDNIYLKIAKNCRGTPRVAIRFIESHIFMQCPIEEVFKAYDIVKDGFTKDDIKVLELLKEKEKGIGLKALSAYLGTSEQNYLYQIEGYLIQKGLITISTRRQITEKGISFLEGLK